MIRVWKYEVWIRTHDLRISRSPRTRGGRSTHSATPTGNEELFKALNWDNCESLEHCFMDLSLKRKWLFPELKSGHLLEDLKWYFVDNKCHLSSPKQQYIISKQYVSICGCGCGCIYICVYSYIYTYIFTPIVMCIITVAKIKYILLCKTISRW